MDNKYTRWVTRNTTRTLKKGHDDTGTWDRTTEVQQVEEGASVTITLDLEALAQQLGAEAMRSKSGKAHSLGGHAAAVVTSKRRYKALKEPERTWNADALTYETVVAEPVPTDDAWHE